MSTSVEQHRAEAPTTLRVAILTISDTRTPSTDTSGAWIASEMTMAGHRVIETAIVPDRPESMVPLLTRWRDRGDIDAALLTGGTGISPRDRTFETVSALLTKPMPGFGELFRMLSYAEIGPATILSRAVGGLMEKMVVLVMPGSLPAVKLALSKIILPELPHLVREARKSS